MTKQETAFVRAVLKVCQEHGFVLVPTFGLRPSAHDPMAVIPLDKDWEGFVKLRTLGANDLADEPDA